ncbi:TadE/TadG family type IV pilus assembly protein [Pelagibacterium xiamenense]|uniref:TadE/TadG family type IV pilus assembly protein n=1 Tax=Pelagibacterium xiamenense TaxID=2901140 RepID=UPI001E287FD4|nr:TadE/TadG family type IV pilus assembly protein [Pelagibacterium xiamenense]MCD7059824.1 pilus assembly protein [Pelagibacterium xiamenense]
MANFRTDEQGVVAVIFALMAIPFIAMAGWAVDYVRIKHVHDFLQAQVDAAALNALVGVTTDDLEDCLVPNDLWEPVFDAAMAAQYDGRWADNVLVVGECLNEIDYRVAARADVPLAFIKLMPGIPDTQAVAVAATARLIEPVEKRGAPVSTFLDSEAGDYNRLWMYCYWEDRPEGDPDRPKRTQMVPIADNGGSEFIADLGVDEEDRIDDPPKDPYLAAEYAEVIATYEEGLDGREQGIWRLESGAGTGDRTYRYFMPNCEDGSHLSFRLENVRFARHSPQFWDSGSPTNNEGDRHTGRFNYYTDTVFTDDGVEDYEGLRHPDSNLPVDIVETVLCDTVDECTKVSAGGVVPEGTGRTPERASGVCESTESETKYMYYGWEDRPPGQTGASGSWRDYAWTDRDFDDITVVIQCPYFSVDGERNARLID